MILIFAIGLVLLRVIYSLGEIYFERDWPRSTWRGLLLSLVLFGLCASAFGQASRFDYQVTTINQSAPQPGGMYPMLAIPGAAVQICNAPANAVPCTNYATTYTSAAMTTACPSNAQFTRPGSNVCVANADAEGGFGFWSS